VKDELTGILMKASIQIAQTLRRGNRTAKTYVLEKKRCGRMVEVLMKIEALVGLPEGLEVGSFDVTDQMITLTVVSTQQKPCCPLCLSCA
jgi:hypothetical protein